MYANDPGLSEQADPNICGNEASQEQRLDQLGAATSLHDLDLPGNRLEPLKGDRKGQYSVHGNDQWRICFEWPKGERGPDHVEIVDYHEEVHRGP